MKNNKVSYRKLVLCTPGIIPMCDPLVYCRSACFSLENTIISTNYHEDHQVLRENHAKSNNGNRWVVKKIHVNNFRGFDPGTPPPPKYGPEFHIPVLINMQTCYSLLVKWYERICGPLSRSVVDSEKVRVSQVQWLKWGGKALSPLLRFEPPAIVWAPRDWIYKVLFYAQRTPN